MGPRRSTGRASVSRFLHSGYCAVEDFEEIVEIFLEENDLMPFEVGFSVLFAFHDVEKDVAGPVFLDVEEVGPLFGLRMHPDGIYFAAYSHGPIPINVCIVTIEKKPPLDNLNSNLLYIDRRAPVV